MWMPAYRNVTSPVYIGIRIIGIHECITAIRDHCVISGISGGCQYTWYCVMPGGYIFYITKYVCLLYYQKKNKTTYTCPGYIRLTCRSTPRKMHACVYVYTAPNNDTVCTYTTVLT